MITKKKLVSAIAAGALIIGACTPAAFADYEHSVISKNNNAQFGFHSHKLFTSLKGEEEVPGPGDQNGYGYARVNVNHEEGQVCVKLYAFNISDATAAHIHHGEDGQAGPVAVPLPAPDERGRASGCVNVSTDLAEDIVDNPSEYYVNIHSTEYPDGAIRGQL